MIDAADSSTTAVMGLYTSATEEDTTHFCVQTLVEGETYPFGEKLALKHKYYHSALFCILKYNAPYIRASSCR
ncbi:hypothetical protein L218DRAFT_965238 [Marasmius fiardii PR-910]|nr:hypothetical protein L218DRAFT_965238 [Marasmius fiardii PR-910]